MSRILTLLLNINLFLILAAFSGVGECHAQGNSIPKSSKVQALEELPDILPDSIKYRYPLFNGLSLSVNIFDPVMEMFGTKHANYEVSLTADLHHRFFPQISVGIGHGNDENDYDLKFHTKPAPFFKVGMLYNFTHNEIPSKAGDFYYALLRYGFSKNTADIRNMTYTDGYWNEFGPADVESQDYACHWVEIGGGIRVQLMRHISLGWEVTLRPLLKSGENKYGKPYFVAGRGASKFGFAFNISYDIF